MVQKLTLEKNVFNKKLYPQLIFTNEIFFLNSVDFWHQKLTLNVQFWHFLSNCNSSTELKKRSFEYVDSWPKVLLFRTHHLWNSTTELILPLQPPGITGTGRHKTESLFTMTVISYWVMPRCTLYSVCGFFKRGARSQ